MLVLGFSSPKKGEPKGPPPLLHSFNTTVYEILLDFQPQVPLKLTQYSFGTAQLYEVALVKYIELVVHLLRRCEGELKNALRINPHQLH